MATRADWARLVALGLQPQWLTRPAAGVPNSGKAPLAGPGWNRAPWWGAAGAAQPSHPADTEGNNLGIQTGHVVGAPLGVVVVDCDSAEALAWADEHLPPTPVVTVTGKGQHRYYQRPAGAAPGTVGGRVKIRLEGGQVLDLDIKADGGQCVAAPSVHWTGHTYSELVPWTADLLAQAPVFDPAWVGSSIAKRSAAAGAGPDPDALVRPGLGAAVIRARVNWLLRHPAAVGGGTGGIDRERTLAALRATLDGAAPLALPGARGATLRDVAWVLARRCPEATTADLVAYLTPAIQAMGDGWDTDSDWGVGAAAAKVASARRKLASDDAMSLATLPSTVAQGEGAAHHAGGTGELPPPSLRRILWVRHPLQPLVWTRRERGDYGPAWGVSAALLYKDRPEGLGWAAASGLAEWYKPLPNGTHKAKSPAELLEDYSSPLDPGRYRLSLSAQVSTFDPHSGAFTEAVCPLRPELVPHFDGALDDWLREFAGPAYGRLVDWLATVADTSRPTPVLALVGESGAGKGLLIDGLSRLWHRERAPSFSSVAGSFQEALAQSPLLVADEYLPESGPGGSDIFEYLREFVTARSHTVNRKGLPLVRVEGCARLIYASNKADGLHIRNANQAAKLALAERFLVVTPTAASVRATRALAPATMARWVEGGGLAAHCLWLAQHHQVQHPGRRLLVEGNGAELIDLASNAKGPTGHLCEAIARFLLQPALVSNASRDCWHLEGGELWVGTSAFEDKTAWEALVPSLDGKRHSTAVLGAALGMLSLESRRLRYVGARSGRAQQRVLYRIDLPQVLAFAVRTGVADRESLEAAVAGAVPLLSVPPLVAPAPPPAPPEAEATAASAARAAPTPPPAPAPAPEVIPPMQDCTPKANQAPPEAAPAKAKATKAPKEPKAPKPPKAPKEPKPPKAPKGPKWLAAGPRRVADDYQPPARCDRRRLEVPLVLGQLGRQATNSAAPQWASAPQATERARAWAEAWQPTLVAAQAGPPMPYARLVAAYRAGLALITASGPVQASKVLAAVLECWYYDRWPEDSLAPAPATAGGNNV